MFPEQFDKIFPTLVLYFFQEFYIFQVDLLEPGRLALDPIEPLLDLWISPKVNLTKLQILFIFKLFKMTSE